jgi:hypothetical protein
VWLNQWITAAIAQKIGAVETAADFFKRRAGNASPEDLRAFLADAPDVPLEPGDKIQTIFASGSNPHRHADDRPLCRPSNCRRHPELGAVFTTPEIRRDGHASPRLDDTRRTRNHA